MRTPGEVEHGAFSHQARLCNGPDELAQSVRTFVEEGLQGGEPVLVMAPTERLAELRSGPGGPPDRLTTLDMKVLGRNPARIIPVLRDWIDRSQGPGRIVCEPIWPGRSQAELVEVLRHEALVEAAFAEAPVKLICVYEEPPLPACARTWLERSHHALGRARGSLQERALKPHPVSELLDVGPPLEAPCGPVERVPVTRDLSMMRRQVRASRAASLLPPSRCQEFVLAVSEAAANAIQYGQPPQALRLWRRDGTVIGEVVGRGRIEDPLVGRRRPAATAIRGRGLWMVNQLCDLVELRSSRTRTTLRMHKRR
jgi:anti-sigma regulatory factor (Ser/Thr protein kinase)